MCDYSLQHVASRPAKIGDKLVTTQFKGSVTRGFASIDEPNVAVCVLPGTEVAFEREVEIEGHGFLSTWRREKITTGVVAQFRALNENQPNSHHDALEFPNGEIVLLTQLRVDQHATVLQLPVSPYSVTEETEGQKRTVVVG